MQTRREPRTPTDVYTGTHASVTVLHENPWKKDGQNKQKTQIKNQTWHLILQKSPRVFKWSAGERLHSSCDVTRLFIWARAGREHWWCRRRKWWARGTGLSSYASVGQHSETKRRGEWAHHVFYAKAKGNIRVTKNLFLYIAKHSGTVKWNSWPT